MEEVPVATAFLRHDAEVLLCHRAADAPTYPGRWGGVSGAVEDGEDPVEAGRREAAEETGQTDLALVRTGDPLTVDAPSYDRTFLIHPVLFDAADRDLELSAELQAAVWLPPTALLERETVPRCFETYRRVAPTVQSIVADDEHGAATLSIRALEVLRDRAGLLAAEGESDLEELRALADRLRRARPSMPVVRNRVNRVFAGSGDGDTGAGASAPFGHDASGAPASTPAAIEQAAIDGINRALAADAEAAMRAAGLVSGWHVLTLSRSGTVFEALAADTATAVSVAESRPACEGVGVAEALDERIDAPVTIHTDAAVAHRLAVEPIDALLVGADAVLPDGRVVNKTGTRAAAIAADREDVPVYVAAATDKITTRETVPLESGTPEAVYDGPAGLDVANPTFDVTPADLLTGVVTERGVLAAEDVAAVARELAALAPK